MSNLNANMEQQFKEIQNQLISGIDLADKINISEINYIAGIDLAYWSNDNKDFAVCCIVIIDFKIHEIVETKYTHDEITVPYITGYLSFSELPLILKTYDILEIKPDVVMFDGNGYLHYRNMGIATHASFYINKPTIGVAKSYLKIDNVEYTVPEDRDGAYTDIEINKTIYGRALRTHKGVKPIFVSCGNWIELDTATSIVLGFVKKESRQPIPIRMADIETRKMRELLSK